MVHELWRWLGVGTYLHVRFCPNIDVNWCLHPSFYLYLPRMIFYFCFVVSVLHWTSQRTWNWPVIKLELDNCHFHFCRNLYQVYASTPCSLIFSSLVTFKPGTLILLITWSSDAWTWRYRWIVNSQKMWGVWLGHPVPANGFRKDTILETAALWTDKAFE